MFSPLVGGTPVIWRHGFFVFLAVMASYGWFIVLTGGAGFNSFHLAHGKGS
jgi:hypothetical protein